MKFVADSVRVVTKDHHQFDNGDIVFRAVLSNGEGSTVRLECAKEIWESLVAFDKRYTVEAEYFMRGYNLGGEIMSVLEEK